MSGESPGKTRNPNKVLSSYTQVFAVVHGPYPRVISPNSVPYSFVAKGSSSSELVLPSAGVRLGGGGVEGPSLVVAVRRCDENSREHVLLVFYS